MKITLFLLSLILLSGCMNANVSGTDVITPYGTANTINAEVSINAIK